MVDVPRSIFEGGLGGCWDGNVLILESAAVRTRLAAHACGRAVHGLLGPLGTMLGRMQDVNKNPKGGMVIGQVYVAGSAAA